MERICKEELEKAKIEHQGILELGAVGSQMRDGRKSEEDGIIKI